MRHSFLIISILLLSFAGKLPAQQISPLPAEKQEQVDKYEEQVNYFRDTEQLEKAASYLNKIAFIYWDNRNPNEAVEYFSEAVSLSKKTNDLESIKRIYSNIALIYSDMEDLQQAKRYFEKSVEVRRELGNKKDIVSGLLDLAYILNLTKDYKEANEALTEALNISKEEEFRKMTLNIYNLLAKNYNELGDNRKHEEFRDKYRSLKQHLETANLKEDYQEREQQSEAELRKTKKEKEETEAEYKLRQLKYERRQDSIQEVVQRKQDSIEKVELKDSLNQVEIEQQNQRMEVQEAKLAEQQARERVQNLIIYSVAGGLLLGVILLVVLFRSNKAKQKANETLEAKNIEIQNKSKQLQDAFHKIEDQNIKITQSISYAQGIQKALFPPKETLNEYIPESFIFFQPVDIVSGDFYWFKEIDVHLDLYEDKDEFEERLNKEETSKDNFLPIENNKFVLSAVDCTGHGVPGAFMSMIGYNLLDGITQNGVTRSERILRELHKGIRSQLKQEETSNRDGMDMSLCVINKRQKTVQFSGAKNPILYIQDGEANVIKGDRVPIGGVQTEKERYFSQHTINVDRPTWFYIFSDGYVDQFGGPKNRKFLLKNLKNLLIENHKKPMEEQEKILSDTLNKWMGGRENQIDDVLVIGFKLGD
ncbi:MAG: tetratricopeptide repeat protein [Bacteroidota bacterium]